ncbi:MAG TPA: polysaccharide biosynthesis C-terminal domain-containing protein [Puia sp.]|nr:polysaccharide biosynthesis C-terminal domain-containing protein [Puia sp.]
MSSIKKLAGQTIWYGASSILARFLYYLLTPYLTLKFAGTSEYGKMSQIFSIIPFLNILVLFSFETAYFRYIQKKESEKNVYDTLLGSLLATTTAIIVLMVLFRQQIASYIRVAEHPGYITISAFIIAADALCALPFARLRHEGRPKKFAAIRVAGILLNIGLTYFFLTICPRVIHSNPNSVLRLIYSPGFGTGYVLIATLGSSLLQLVFLSRELTQFRWSFNSRLWKEIMLYSLPLTIAGFGGMINETFDRIMLARRLPLGAEQASYQVGIYAACYKLSLLITLFVQAFRMGAEPFFFKQSSEENAPRTYARIMKFFVITICLMFLFVALYIDIWKYFIKDEGMWVGLKVVPILLFANMFLGIYYNLSIWYKLSNRTLSGAYITLIGAAITLIINYLFIPKYGYMASAWATFFCYGSMMVISFVWGQREYRVPYAWKKLVAYMVIVAVLYFLHHFATGLWKSDIFSLALATLLAGGYTLFVLRVERREFQRMPYIGRFLGGGTGDGVVTDLPGGPADPASMGPEEGRS